jgi:hypothetical protein
MERIREIEIRSRFVIKQEYDDRCEGPNELDVGERHIINLHEKIVEFLKTLPNVEEIEDELYQGEVRTEDGVIWAWID